MSEKYLYWLAVEDGKAIRFADLPHMMAKAMHPDSDMGYGAARVNLEEELPKAVQRGELVVRNPLDMGHHTFPFGDALKRAVMLPHDLRPFLESRGIELRLNPHGSGPEFWTIENAALAIAEQEGWHDGARGTLLDQMVAAANARELTVRDPHTGLHKKSGEVHQYWELITAEDVNNWLASKGVKLRWEPRADEGPTFPWPNVMHGHRVWRLRDALAEVARNVGSHADSLLDLAKKGIADRSLMARNLAAGGISVPGDDGLPELIDWFFSDDINAWLDTIGAPFAFRLPTEASLSPQPQSPTQSAQDNGGVVEVTYHLPLFARLEPRTPWAGGRMAATDILPIADAAKLASRHAGEEVTVGDFLRAGARGEIRIRAVCPRTVSMLPARKGDIVLTMQQGSYPSLPQDACEMLSITGRAAWRICEGFEPVEVFGGTFCRFTRWKLPDGEPDLVTTINDCLVMGSDVHALADAFTPDEVLMDDRPYDEKATAPDVVLMTSPVRRDVSRAANRTNPREDVPEKEQASAPVFSMTRAALVTRHEHHWPTIQSDLKNASTNGLAQAKAGARDWNEPLALDWARANNKLVEEAPASADPLAQAMRNLSALPGRKNVLKG